MCGLAGIINFDNSKPDLNSMNKMLAILSVRGPDDFGTWEQNNILFGHRRLSVLDLSDNGHQPMVNEAVAVVFNGTIYNFQSLRSELQKLGFSFKSTGDTEVILKAYQAWGLDCVQKFIGMFAIALWDKNTQKLHLIRDRFGIKPLYYSLQNNRLVFASNPQAILSVGGVDTELHNESLHFHFSLHAVVPAPNTILNGIKKVPPATILTLENRQLTPKKYWTLNSKLQNFSDKEWQEKVYAALNLSIKRRVENADVSVGVLLSGGIDSSLLVGLLAEQGVHNLKTFSIGFEDDSEERGDEFEFSDCVAEHFSTQHHKIIIPNNEVLHHLPEAISAMAEPMFGQDSVAFYLLSKEVAKSVKVVQSGQGADEVFGGYFWYQKLQQSDNEWRDFHYNYVDRDHYEFSQMLDDKYQSRNITAQWLQDKFTKIPADDFLSKVLNLDATNLIVDDPIKRVDNMTMAFGLESRVPFLDHELVELVAGMPPHLKLADGGKTMLKIIARNILPEKVVNRPKVAFPMPALRFIRGDFLTFMRDILLSKVARERGLYQPNYVDKLLANPTNYFTRINGSKLWQLALTEFWLQTNGL